MVSLRTGLYVAEIIIHFMVMPGFRPPVGLHSRWRVLIHNIRSIHISGFLTFSVSKLRQQVDPPTSSSTSHISCMNYVGASVAQWLIFVWSQFTKKNVLRLLGLRQGARGGTRTCDSRISADLSTDSLSSVQLMPR
ncbi:hypothetical protein PoB_005501300 [Plakobranchus ocellatus]|uniref:Uncharacterized protein n=1 Tax=Plakobranchus ocellatus TaxID=259542 RepID=A0AAV4C9E6_9GAST|nr:hypothetical protein PoB_005501300 [Plakobranchus ocellatus]